MPTMLHVGQALLERGVDFGLMLCRRIAKPSHVE
jgi:hypothetical protein